LEYFIFVSYFVLQELACCFDSNAMQRGKSVRSFNVVRVMHHPRSSTDSPNPKSKREELAPFLTEKQ